MATLNTLSQVGHGKLMGLPPPTFTVETTSQFGSRVNTYRTETGVGGGGTLEFGKFREDFERAVQDAGWKFVYEIA